MHQVAPASRAQAAAVVVFGLALVAAASWRPTRLEPGSWVERSRGRAAARLHPTLPLSLNEATAAELVSLPGVGPVLAKRIVAFRERAGPFSSASELRKVPGIGPVKLERLRAYVEVGRASEQVDQIADPQTRDQQEGVEVAR